MHTFSRVSVIGLGYIGLPTAAVIASRGVDVLGVDVSEHAVNTINQGKIHIVEPDLDMLVQAAVTTGKLKASLTPEPAEAFMIAVPTPFKDNKSPDLSYIRAAVENIAPVISKGNLIVLESTSPVGTTDQISAWLAELRPDLIMPHQDPDKADVYIAHCPERVLPGRVLQELVSNDRIIGGITERCAARAVDLYHLFVRGECLLTNARTAEMAKLTENSFRDVNIAFANELSMICDHLKINVWELIKLANRHPRVNILLPGPGVGGHCIAVDPWFIVDSAPEQAQIIRKAREINDSKPHYVADKIKQAADQFKKPVIACLGLAFKADIDDLRESPALDIAMSLIRDNVGEILLVEPNIKQLPAKYAAHADKLTPLPQALERANVLVVLVDHKQFKTLHPADVATKVVIDTRGIFG
ncbi:MAG: UDP-N-acetyl-D-mannosamine dehydrogenase [Gammaproteobacteria bacterium]|nr:UDP-N-acetyl-D-mannosamine dehydrogenase [Gammaproteobacteria bacterium]MBU1556050.1 UDP-N-acetyl-D-mannosamine dehydrogenase [Gammaproteobacteria bacterium]MBU2069213.1 UDP-N-acetyl-D-mannosamine dehydrogenase [Gammaproteobacteria bacterium]MBU2182308.1 UDP-N-acetyl-D-mannosamine dehydrogenase [Gammaproteobacteria bacterium]MBU2204920.1 UDP-N-acetyl-D-mannosamine dehydrogenase [Gammaproteobacteria bacterium]